jgi:S1-C subfamily serine protease
MGPVSMPVVSSGESKEFFFKRYWPHLAVAATVAIVSVVGTLITVRSLEEKQTAYYQVLRRIVDKTTKELKSVKDDIAKTKNKDDRFAGKYTGTGFLISSAGFIVTSHHVIKGADSVYVQNEVLGRFKANILFSDPDNDVAILRIDDPLFKSVHNVPFRINPEEASLGENVFTLGFPREDIVFGEGSVSAATGFRQNENAYQVSVPVNPGNSGGPLMNEQGDVIGIISGIQTETSGAAFAIKSRILLDVIKEVPDSLKTSLKLPVQSYLRGSNKVQQIKRWKEFVFMVKVFNNK